MNSNIFPANSFTVKYALKNTLLKMQCTIKQEIWKKWGNKMCCTESKYWKNLALTGYRNSNFVKFFATANAALFYAIIGILKMI